MEIDEAAFQEFMLSLAGEPFRPSNGTEGEMFHESFCYRCKKWDELKGCDIERNAFYNLIGPDYPKEWIYDQEGYPTCMAFDPDKKGEK